MRNHGAVLLLSGGFLPFFACIPQFCPACDGIKLRLDGLNALSLHLLGMLKIIWFVSRLGLK
ncbi:hypothetical protein DFH08DRAFT_867245 [Mycena albidolilacea]|uniref:Uncharacterized protein n=1 Tax=Mycena albidolilacea TaxID=1033008 RepID=A0AAD7A3B4_9AGAR|nr:hypothetical protein DFH08DRAFT_867245 [Mycena albidolilacea]